MILRRDGIVGLLWLGLVACGDSPALHDDASFDRLAPADAATTVALRIMAANTTSGSRQSYDSGEGIRMFQGLKPDVVLIQEFNIGDNSAAAVRAFVDTTFDAQFSVFREATGSIPNGIISRYPIAQSGSWSDPRVTNRGFAWAKISVPGPHALWAVSLHLLTSGSSNRASEADAVVAQVKAFVPAADYLVVGGDLNTGSRTEPCVTTLSQIVVTSGPYPVDTHGNDSTSGSRSKAHDWLMPDAVLARVRVPTRVGAQTFATGLVFDSRTFTPLADVAPVQVADSGASNMQHMPIVTDYALPQ